MPKSLQFWISFSTCAAAILSTIGNPRGVVGVLWSVVAIVKSGRRTFSPRARRSVEGLRRRHFMHQVQIDIEQRGSVRALGNYVVVPDLFDDRARFINYSYCFRYCVSYF